jgi:hypothetical protein
VAVCSAEIVDVELWMYAIMHTGICVHDLELNWHFLVTTYLESCILQCAINVLCIKYAFYISNTEYAETVYVHRICSGNIHAADEYQ